MGKEILEKLERIPQRAVIKALGIDLNKPLVGIITADSDMVLAHKGLPNFTDKIIEGVISAGGNARVMTVSSLCTELARGGKGAKYNLPMRELTADCVEAITSCEIFDGLVFVGNNPSTLSGMLIGALRVKLPSIFFTPGVMREINYGDRKMSIENIYKTIGLIKSGKMPVDCVTEIENSSLSTVGNACDNYSENSMSIFLESVGLSLQGVSTTECFQLSKLSLAFNTGTQIMKMVQESIIPQKILSSTSFNTACVVDMAMGSSSTSLLNLFAISKRLDIKYSLKDAAELALKIPQLVDISASTNCMVQHFNIAGGVYALLKELSAAKLIILDNLTCYNKKMSLCVKNSAITDIKTIKPISNSFAKAITLSSVYGNLATDGALAFSKSGVLTFSGKAIVFESEELAIEAIMDRQIAKGSVIVIRNEGPRGGPGMREIFTAQQILKGLDLDKDVAIITDGRISNTTDGIVIGHITPEPIDDGLLGYVKNGDTIEINLTKNRLNLDINAKEINNRKKTMEIQHNYCNSLLKKYQQNVNTAHEGATITTSRK